MVPEPLVLVKAIQAEMDLSRYSIVLSQLAPPYPNSIASINPGYPDLPMTLKYWKDLYNNLYVFYRVIKHELCHLKLWEEDGYKVTPNNEDHMIPFTMLAHEFGGECRCHPDRFVMQFISDHTKEAR